MSTEKTIEAKTEAALTYPAALAAWIRAATAHDGEAMPEEEVAAEVAERVAYALDQADPDPRVAIGPEPTQLFGILGGVDYLRAVQAWRLQCNTHPRRHFDAPAVPRQ
jgi:hypothetical protein